MNFYSCHNSILHDCLCKNYLLSRHLWDFCKSPSKNYPFRRISTTIIYWPYCLGFFSYCHYGLPINFFWIPITIIIGLIIWTLRLLWNYYNRPSNLFLESYYYTTNIFWISLIITAFLYQYSDLLTDSLFFGRKHVYLRLFKASGYPDYIIILESLSLFCFTK